MTKPNFIIGGTSAGGTSFLSAILVQHPEIYLPREMRPEPHYFYKSWEYINGIEYYLSKWFSKVPDNSIAIGERSSSYLYGGESVAKKIIDVFPDIKLIFTLRNPIERAWANYRYTVLQGLEDLSFEDALKAEPERTANASGIWSEIQPHDYTGRGFYFNQLSQFYKYFQKNNIHVLKSELLSSQTDLELKKIYSFLGLSTSDFKYKRAPDHTSVNVANPSLQKELRDYFGVRFDKLIESIRREESIIDLDFTQLDLEKIQQLSENMVGIKQPIPLLARNYLQDIYKSDVSQLQNIVDFDCSDWLNYD